jgi:rubredoxin
MKEMKYVCTVCGYIYDEDVEGTKFDELPEDWTCPLCNLGKDVFEVEE